MSEGAATFGARYAALPSVTARAALEAAENRRGGYASVDAVLDRLVLTAMRGGRIAELVPAQTKRQQPTVELEVPLSDDERGALAEHFEVGNQEKRGAWYVPEGETLSLGLMHTVYWARRSPRMTLNLADAERVAPLFRGAPEAVAVWVLEPLFEELFLPLKLRGLFWLGKKSVEEQEKHWAVIDPLYSALGLDPEPLAAFRPGTGWSRHSSEDIIALRQALAESWARAPEDVGARYRAYRLGQVIERYYKKAKNGRALRKGVLTKAAGRTLTAYFGGGWLEFLAYLGEQPHDNEQVIQALPETKLLVGTSDRAAAVAAEHGLADEEVQRILAAYWQQTDSSSPVEQRVDVIKRFWTKFDELHAIQQPGMPSLWGLVDDVGIHLGDGDDDNGVYAHGRHAEVLPADLNADIERLWGTTMLPRWPERIVSEPAPHARLAEAIGPALRFWHGAGLTAWFLCEGPYSRTDMDGLANYHQRELEALTELGCPIDGELFRELRGAEKRLEPVEPEYDSVSESDVGHGLSISISISTGRPKLKGFEQLRDIITRHRRAWTAQHFDKYIRARWEHDLRAVGDLYNRQMAQRTKAPTVKQFAKAAAPAANMWFGGNITGVYSVLGLKSPPAPTQTRLLPADASGFARRVFVELGGQPRDNSPVTSAQEREAQWQRNNRSGAIDALARMAVDYVQLEEALGRPPELKEFGTSRFKYRSEALSEDIDEAFRVFSETVQRVRETFDVDTLGPDILQQSVQTEASSAEPPGAALSRGPVVIAEPWAAPVAPALQPPGWYEDPTHEAALRWWDGQSWTDQTTQGQSADDQREGVFSAARRLFRRRGTA